MLGPSRATRGHSFYSVLTDPPAPGYLVLVLLRAGAIAAFNTAMILAGVNFTLNVAAQQQRLATAEKSPPSAGGGATARNKAAALSAACISTSSQPGAAAPEPPAEAFPAASAGGAVFVIGGKVNASACILADNVAAGLGGAIYFAADSAGVGGSSLTNTNISSADGIISPSWLILLSTWFLRNRVRAHHQPAYSHPPFAATTRLSLPDGASTAPSVARPLSVERKREAADTRDDYSHPQLFAWPLMSLQALGGGAVAVGGAGPGESGAGVAVNATLCRCVWRPAPPLPLPALFVLPPPKADTYVRCFAPASVLTHHMLRARGTPRLI